MANPNWVKGVSGNPKGCITKSRRYFSKTVRELLESKEIDVTFVIDNGEGKPGTKRIKVESDKALAYGLAAAMIVRGMKGDAVAIRELINRAEGRAPEVDREDEGVQKSGQVIKYGDKKVEF